MKLNELTGVKRFKDLGPVNAIIALKKEFAIGNTSLKLLGKGAHAVALSDGKTVFKFWYKDSAYEDFVHLAMQHQSNPFFPKFKSKIKTLPKILKIEGKPADIRYVKIEVLEPIKSGADLSVPMWEGSTNIEIDDLLVRNAYQLNKIVEIFDNVGTVDEAMLTLIKKKFQQNGIPAEPKLVKDWTKKIRPEFHECIEAARLIYDLEDLKGHTLDLHAGNMCKRGEQLVFLDPVANRIDLGLCQRILNLQFA